MHFSDENVIKQAVFYLNFSVLGYYIAQSSEYFRRANLWLIAIVSLVILDLVTIFRKDVGILNIQANKFPPNFMYFLFSCNWASIFIFLSFRVSVFAKKIERCGYWFWLKSFISSRYSISFWQGVGYTVAMNAGKMQSIRNLAVWVLALALSRRLGLLAAPAERVRIRFLILIVRSFAFCNSFARRCQTFV